MNTEEPLEQKIASLIASKREGPYWDFKVEHHSNNAELLHDILCMANSLTKCDKLIIFGVSDHSKGCDIIGLDGKFRRSQAELIDFIRTKSFAGDFRPEVELFTISVSGKEIDVIRIIDWSMKPFYLTQDYRDRDKVVKAHHIYTRIVDTNTPIDKSADLYAIEYLWRERFGLDLQPSDRFLNLLRMHDEWDIDVGNREFAYHKFHPEFRIQFGPPKEMQEIYSFFYPNERSFVGNASFQYLATELFSLQYVYCDEMRVLFSAPSYGLIFADKRKIFYFYYELNSRSGAFLTLLTNGSLDFNSRGSQSAFCLFRDKEERESFEMHVRKDLEAIMALPDSEIASCFASSVTRAGKTFNQDINTMFKIQIALHQWRDSNESTPKA